MNFPFYKPVTMSCCTGFFFLIKNNKTIKQSAQQQLPTLYTLNRQTNFAEDIKLLNCIVGLEIGMDLHK